MAAPLSPARGSPRRRAAIALVLAVAVGHVAIVSWLAAHVHSVIGDGAADSRRPPPIEVSFLRELEPTAPPSAPPAPPARRSRSRPAAAPPAPAASAPEVAAEESIEEAVDPATPSAGPVAGAPEQRAAEEPVADAPAASAEASASEAAVPEVAALHGAAASEAAAVLAEAASDASAPPFEWPPSTRLEYRLSGWYRGEVEGSARVEWVRAGDRYQVRMEVVVGPSFAPLITRRMVSDGELTADGLRPLRYDEETAVVTRPTRLLTLHLDGERVRLAGGRTAPRLEGLQDPSSQFVQLTWLFTLQPHLLRAGQVVEFPLALPRRVERWRYEVVGEEMLAMPFGTVGAVHVRPSREVPRPGRDLLAEAWFAPTLQYLPVRLLIRQDEETFVDLVLSSRPLQAP